MRSVEHLEMIVDTSETSLGNFGIYLPSLKQLKLNGSHVPRIRWHIESLFMPTKKFLLISIFWQRSWHFIGSLKSFMVITLRSCRFRWHTDIEQFARNLSSLQWNNRSESLFVIREFKVSRFGRVIVCYNYFNLLSYMSLIYYLKLFKESHRRYKTNWILKFVSKFRKSNIIRQSYLR